MADTDSQICAAHVHDVLHLVAFPFQNNKSNYYGLEMFWSTCVPYQSGLVYAWILSFDILKVFSDGGTVVHT